MKEPAGKGGLVRGVDGVREESTIAVAGEEDAAGDFLGVDGGLDGGFEVCHGGVRDVWCLRWYCLQSLSRGYMFTANSDSSPKSRGEDR